MKKKAKSWIRVGVLASAFYLINTLGPPISARNALLQKNDLNKVTSALHTEKYVYSYSGNDEEKALNYLVLSHAITMTSITTKNMGYDDYKGSLDDLLERRVGDCSETAMYTYANFMYLIKSTNNLALAEQVRYASGKMRVNGKKGLVNHEWLEVKANEKWVPYETNIGDMPNNHTVIPEKISQATKNNPFLWQNDSEYIKSFSIQIMPDDGKKLEMNVINCLKDYEGIAGSMIRKWILKN